MRISVRPRKSSAQLYSECPRWIYTEVLDAEMKRRLELKDKRKGEPYGLQNS